jgi:hypothetical protein
MYENNQSPLSYLAAFAISFAAGALSVMLAKVYADGQSQDNQTPAPTAEHE